MTDRSKGKNVKRACFFDRLVLVPAVVIYFMLVPLVVRAAALERVNASYGAISGSMAQTWVAKEARLYEKYGLDLNLVYISGGPRSIMSLIGGSVQFVNHSGMPALEAYQRGADTALIASPLNQLEHSLVVQKTIASAEQLRGKILGMSTAGSLTDILLREGLRLNGISEKDVTILPSRFSDHRLLALVFLNESCANGENFKDSGTKWLMSLRSPESIKTCPSPLPEGEGMNDEKRQL